MAEALSDGFVRATLRRYAHAADGLLQDPDSWVEDPPAERLGFLRRLGRLPLAVPRRVLGVRAEQWDAMPADARVEWWLRRIRTVVVPVAATPRIFGLAADRLPLQAAFGASASGLAVCAVAREHGIENPDDWVPLLAQVLMDRELPPDAPGSEGTEQAEEEPAAEPEAPEVKVGLMRRGGRAVWGLAKILYGLYGAFDGRPRGPWVYRLIGKVPVVGLAGGVLDERAGVRRAAEETTRLLAARSQA